MPVKTPYFALEAFVSGDAFSASTDQRRMRQIDSHLAFLADIIGKGVIDGWTLSEQSPLVLSVSAGWGIVDRHVTRTFGPLTKTLLDNNTVYLWMKRRPGIVGQVSAFSNMGSFSHSDSTAPSIPASLSLVAKTISTINFDWSGGSELDFDHFNIYRSTNNIDYSLVGTATEAEFLDTGLSDGTLYYYKVSSVDQTGNESARSSALSVVTTVDTSPPSDPSSVEATAADTAIHLIWRAAAIGNIDYYQADYTPVTVEGVISGSTQSQTVSGTQRYMTISGLTNGQRYRVVLKSVGTNGVASDGVTRHLTPDDLTGPKDVTEIVITDAEGDGIISDVVLMVSWSPFADPYDPDSFASYHEVQLREFDGDGGVITSEWIAVPDGDSIDIKVFSYSDGGTIVNKSIEERTEYYVTVRAVDANGVRSVGKKAVYSTRSFKKPNPVTMLTARQLEDQSIVFTWINSNSIFEKNVVSVTKTDLDNASASELLEDETDIGRATRYIIEPDEIEANHDYSIVIKAVDEFGNESVEQTTFYSIPDLDEIARPPVPTQQIGVAGDRQATIAWNKAALEYASGYRIYRAEEQVVYSASDFTRLDTVSADTYTYTDYGIDNESIYVYFVTTVDIYGRESLNPVDDEYFDYNLITLTPNRTGDMSHPEDLQVGSDGSNGVVLSWTPSGGVFDGYEIFRSFGNRYDFEQVATVGASITTYTDADVLTKNGTYYYLVRKFRNEADLFVTESDVEVAGAVYIGTVVTADGEMTFDIEDVRDLKDLRDPIREEADVRIRAHKHRYYSDVDDRRINLGDTITVTDWTTSDYQQYFTDADLTDTTTFSVLLNGEKPENLGIFYVLDKDEKRLTFERRLTRGNRTNQDPSEFPFAEPPTLEVTFDNLSEVQGSLPRERIEGASAQQVSVGLVYERQLPSLNHEGRIRERLIPVQENTIPVDDGFRFAPEDADVEHIGQALVWYDVILAEGNDGDVLVAATSDGIYTSTDFGLTWEKKFEPITPVLKLYYSPTNDFYFALTNRGVFGSGGGSAGGFSVWSEIRGMENTKIARDIVEDGDGTVFCTSDLGVYKLKRDVGRGSYFWEQTPIFGPRSTEAFAILYDELRDRVIISNELGIFETPNDGVRWDFSDEMPEQRAIYAMFRSGDYIFAATQYMVWRRGPDDSLFQRIAVLDGVDMVRKIAVWKNRIYITTDLGIMVSKADADILEDSTVDFISAFGQINRGGYVAPVTSLNLIDGKLFVGTEERLYIAETPGRISLQSQIENGVMPTVYVDEVEYKIGYRFTTNTERLRKFICFDEKIPVGAKVTFANQYKKYKATNGGWADADYSAKVVVYKDGRKINDGTVIEKPIIPMGTLRFPVYNDRNAHQAGADAQMTRVTEALRSLLASETQGETTVFTGFNKENVRVALYRIEKFLSQLYASARVVEELDEDGNPVYRDASGNIVDRNAPGAEKSYVPFSVPPFNVLLISCGIDPSSVGITSFGKYNDLYDGDGGVGSFGDELDDNGNVPGGATPSGFGSGGSTGSSGSGSSGSSGSETGGAPGGSGGATISPTGSSGG